MLAKATASSMRWLVVGILAVSCGGRLAPAPAQPAAPRTDPNLAPTARLGDASLPTGYHLRVGIDPREVRFVGEITIDVELREDLHTFWLHRKKLHIVSATFERDNQKVPLRTRRSQDDEELLGLAAEETLRAGPGKLQIEFSGDLGNLQGLFRQIQDGRWYAYSDFEATDARAAFPCYDDPRFKVPWDVEIKTPAGNLAFANAPEVARETQSDGSVLFRFGTTRPLPSYLIAMAVGPFDVIEGKAWSTPLRIIAPKGHAGHGRFVLENTGRWIHYLEEYLGMAMPFPKLDFIAVPHFGGAMENPGLVTFSANILLTGATPTDGQRRRAAGVTTHELAHMWFGNLVTPDYWNDLWLNEAFATWLSDKAVAHWQPARARDILDIADKSTAFDLDHSVGARMVREPIKDRTDIRAAFDAITYRKGGALLTMLEAWLGEEKMRQGVRAYLHSHAGGSVRAKDLIAALSSIAPKKQAGRILDSFLEQAGIPRLALKLRCDKGVRVEIEQSRYLPLTMQDLASNQDRQGSWHLPVCLRYPTGEGNATKRQCIRMSEKRTTLKLQSTHCPEWILPNDQESGYYHYLLDAPSFAALAHAHLDRREELGLVHNLAAALRSGDLGVGDVLPQLEPYAKAGSLHVQQVLVPLLYELKRSIIGADESVAFAQMIRRWYRGQIDALGLAAQRGEPEEDQLLRPVLIHLLADIGDDRDLQAQARTRVMAWLERPVVMNMSLLDSLLQAAAIRGDAGLAARYLEAISKTSDRRHSAVLLGALHAFADAEILDAALERSIPRHLALPNLMPVLVRLMARPKTRAQLLQALFAKREAILGKGDGQREKFEHIAPIFATLCDEEGKAAVRKFSGSEIDAQPVIDSIAGCMAFQKAQQENASAAFAASDNR